MLWKDKICPATSNLAHQELGNIDGTIIATVIMLNGAAKAWLRKAMLWLKG